MGQEQKPDDNKGLKKWDKMRARKFISGPNFAHLSTWVLKTRLIEKKYPSYLLMPNFRILQEDSQNVGLKIWS